MYNPEGCYNSAGDWVRGWRDPVEIKLSEQEILFNKIYEQINRAIPSRSDWENGNGYFTHAVNSTKTQTKVALNPGEMVKSVHTSRRKMIFLGTELGTVVFFEAQSPGTRNNRITFCATDAMHDSGLLKYADMDSAKRMQDYIFGTTTKSSKFRKELAIYVAAQEIAKQRREAKTKKLEV